jgi:hypothetical protein
LINNEKNGKIMMYSTVKVMQEKCKEKYYANLPRRGSTGTCPLWAFGFD